MGAIFAVFRNTTLETVRQPLYGLVLAGTCLLIALSPAMAAHIYTFGAGTGLERAPERMVADLGLATLLLGGLVLAVFSATRAIDREVEEHTALTVLSKRVSRTAFVFGKFAGVGAAVSLATLAAMLFLLMTVRVGAAVSVTDRLQWSVAAAMAAAALGAVGVATWRNYTRSRPWIGSFCLSFVATAGAAFLVLLFFDQENRFVFSPSRPLAESFRSLATAYDWEVARAGLLTLEAILVMTGVAVAAGTRLGTGGNAAVCAVVFLGGLTSEYFARAHVEQSVLARVWYTAMPNLQTFWMSDALTRERPIPTAYLLHASGYAACYLFATLFVAAFLFQRREVV